MSPFGYFLQVSFNPKNKNKLEKQRLKKWNKIEEKPPKDHTNSVKTTDNNANSYSTKSHHQEEQGSGIMMEQCH